MIVTIDDSASVRLFTASSTIAIEFDMKPTAALNTTSTTFATMPTTLVRTMTLSRCAASMRTPFSWLPF